MIQVSKERILELQTIIKEDYGREIDFSHASSIAHDMVGYFDLLAKLNHQKNAYENNTK
jgi:hypothetical protein